MTSRWRIAAVLLSEVFFLQAFSTVLDNRVILTANGILVHWQLRGKDPKTPQSTVSPLGGADSLSRSLNISPALYYYFNKVAVVVVFALYCL